MASVAFERFGGLNLDDPGEIGGEVAQDCLNVELDTGGRVRTRRGYEHFVTARDYATVWPTGVSGDFVIGTTVSATVRSTDLYAVDSSGGETSLGVITKLGGAVGDRPFITSVASVGTLTATYTYIASYYSPTARGGLLQRFDNVSTLTPHATAAPKYVAAWQGRLVQGHYISAAVTPSGANGSTSTVFFSDPGSPDTTPSTNWVSLDPGNGEEITGIVTWRELLVVFKETAAYVFYGTSTDSTGGAIFNYRKIDLGARINPARLGERPITVGRDGIYFLSVEGRVYKTSGDTPAGVSPWFFSQGAGTVSTDLFWAGDRLHVKAAGGPQSDWRWLVYDPNTGFWVAWGIGLSSVFDWSAPVIADAAIVFQTTGSSNVYAMQADASSWLNPSLAVTTDDGAAIDWRWQSGWYDLGSPNSKRAGPVVVAGSGTVTASVFADYGSTDASSSAVTLGTYPALARAQQSKTRRGRRFSHRLSGSGFAVVRSVELTVRDQRVL